jgi:hypothetical protein
MVGSNGQSYEASGTQSGSKRFCSGVVCPIGDACRVWWRRFRVGNIVGWSKPEGKLRLLRGGKRSERRRLRGRRQLRGGWKRTYYNLGSGIDANVPLTGSDIQSGSSLTIKLTDGMMVDDSFTTTLASSGTSPIENFDSSGSGTLYPQSASGFTPIGAYSYTVEGEEQGTLTGSGQLVVGPGDTFTGGIFSETDGGTEMQYQSVSGFIYPPNAAGRGQAAVEGNNMSYYVISPTQIEMIGLDERALLLIPAQKQ